MLEKMKSSIQVEEEKSIKNTSLYIRNVEINEESYETKMLLEENIEDVLKFQIVYEGENSALRFDVSKTISLDEYLKSNKLKKRDLCDIIDDIDSMLSSIENYLISENSVSLDPRLLRVDKSEKNKFVLKFVIIPNYKSSFSYELSKFLIRILRHVDVEDKNALNLGYGLFVRSSKDNYTISDLMELIDSVRDHKKSDIKELDLDALNAYDEEVMSEMAEIVPEEINVEEYEDVNDKKDESMNIVMDKNTNDLLKEELFENFDKKDNKGEKNIIKFKKKIFDFKPKKALNAHIVVNICKNALIPIACILVPMILYLIYGTEKMMKYLPMICLYEIILLIVYVINNIRESKSD